MYSVVPAEDARADGDGPARRSAKLPDVLTLPLLVLLAAAPIPTAADVAPGPSHQLEVELGRDLAITGGAATFWLTTELLKPYLAPEACRWCDGTASGADGLNGFDRLGYDHLRWEATTVAARLSDLGAYIVVPLSMFGGGALLAANEGAAADIPENLLIVAQAAAISGVVNQTVKLLVGRQRPYAHRGTDTEALSHNLEDSNLSFYSGHTNIAFVLAASMGTVAELRGYENAWMVWAVGMPLAATVGYLRVAADRHYLTDVLVGAAMGTTIGIVVPLLLHPRKSQQSVGAMNSLQMSAAPGGLSFSGTF